MDIRIAWTGNYIKCFLYLALREIKAQEPEAKFAYGNALKTGKVKVYRARIMLIGQDRAGITVVACSLFYLATACYCKLLCSFSASFTVCSQVINADHRHESQLVLSFSFCSVWEREVR